MDFILWAVKRLGLLLCGVVFSLLLGEAFLRFFMPQVTYGGGLGYRDDAFRDLKPNYSGVFSHPDFVYEVKTDQHRMRTTWNEAKTLPKLSVAVLGDSFAFGMGVAYDETIPSVISRQLHSWGISVRVSNASSPGYSLKDVRCKYLRLRHVLRADIVVVTTNFGDWATSPGECEGRLAIKDALPSVRGSLTETLWMNIYPTLRDTLLGHSQLAVFLAVRSNLMLIRMGVRDSFKDIAAAYNPEVHKMFRDRTSLVVPILSRLHSEILRDGAQAIFVYIPGYVEVNDNLWRLLVGGDKKPYSRNLVRKFLTGAARKAGFTRIIDPLEESGGKKELQGGYFPVEMHQNAKGNRYMANLVSAVIREMYRKGGFKRASR